MRKSVLRMWFFVLEHQGLNITEIAKSKSITIATASDQVSRLRKRGLARVELNEGSQGSEKLVYPSFKGLYANSDFTKKELELIEKVHTHPHMIKATIEAFKQDETIDSVRLMFFIIKEAQKTSQKDKQFKQLMTQFGKIMLKRLKL